MKTSGVLILGVLCCITPALNTEFSDTEAQVAEGLEIAKDMIEDIGTVVGTFFPPLEIITSVIGALFGFISLLFSSESPEIKYMRVKFGEVNMKLNSMTKDLDDIKHIIMEENLKTAFIVDEMAILNGYEQLQDFINELQNLTCTDKDRCSRERMQIAERYLPSFDINKNMENIYRGAMDNTTVFSKPLIEQIKLNHQCDVPKIQKFADGVFKLAYKAKQVIIVHEMLSGSAYSITHIMNTWLKRMYTLKDYVNAQTEDCFRNIKRFIVKDIRHPRYQSNFHSNSAAANAMRSDLEAKYSWLHWVVMVYDVDDDNEIHDWTLNEDGEFEYYPLRKDGGKRNILVTFLDKGTYSLEVKEDVSDTLNYLFRNSTMMNFFRENSRRDIADVHLNMVSELQRRGVWSRIKSFTILFQQNNFYCSRDPNHFERVLEYARYVYGYKILAVFKSNEERTIPICSLRCQNGGECKHNPFSTTYFCDCKHFFYGQLCEFRSNVTMATHLEAMVKQIRKIPKLTDIYFELHDMKNYIGISLGNIQNAISQLGKSIAKAFMQLHENLSKQFRWIGLVAAYNEQIQSLQYFIQLFEDLGKSKTNAFSSENCALAEAVLGSQRYNGIRRWLHDFNNLVNGTSGFTLTPQKPLLISYMEQFKDRACTQEYKTAIDNVWRQLMLLQYRGYIVWIQALQILNDPTDFAIRQYEDYTNSQMETLKKKTCNLMIPFSENINCTDGYYLNERNIITAECKPNYYLRGFANITCTSTGTSCLPCSCSLEGSVKQECDDQTGQCTCKNSYYGTKCENRDCAWSNWTEWSNCQICNYGYVTRTRRELLSKRGAGSNCVGNTSEARRCFHRCCSDQFHCTRTEKCINASQKCDNVDDCGDNEDEDHCCGDPRYTRWSSDESGNSIYLYRHHLDCGDQRSMINFFKMETRDHQIRYKYICCNFTRPFCSMRQVSNPPTESNKKLIYLDKQYVDCGPNGMLNGFQLILPNTFQWKYNYKCCDVYKNVSHTCYNKRGPYTTQGNAGNIYLDRQSVQCDGHSYLSYFHLERNPSHTQIRYNHRCCYVQ